MFVFKMYKSFEDILKNNSRMPTKPIIANGGARETVTQYPVNSLNFFFTKVSSCTIKAVSEEYLREGKVPTY